MSGWSEVWQNVVEGWSKAGQQILLNQNQPLVMESGPWGTKIYQTGPGTPGAVLPAQPSTPEGVIRSGSSGLVLLVLGAIALYLVIQSKEGD